jgi:hypothetical protein
VTAIQIETCRRGRACAVFARQRIIFAPWAVLSSVLIFAIFLEIQVVEAVSTSTQTVSLSKSIDNEKTVLRQLWPVLDLGKNVVRVYYGGSCLQDAKLGVLFRQLNVRPAGKGESGAAAVKNMLRDEKNVSVEEDNSGVIRVRIGRVPDTILQVRIPRLNLPPEEQYNASPAVWAVLNASEVQSAMRDHHLGTPIRAVNMILVRPADGLPHLPGVTTDVTVDQAFDIIARTFRGAIVYKACSPPDQYEVDFADARYIAY